MDEKEIENLKKQVLELREDVENLKRFLEELRVFFITQPGITSIGREPTISQDQSISKELGIGKDPNQLLALGRHLGLSDEEVGGLDESILKSIREIEVDKSEEHEEPGTRTKKRKGKG